MKLFHRISDDLDFGSFTEATQNLIWQTSEGNPRMICELVERFRKEQFLTIEIVETICKNYIGKETKQVDMSIYLLLIFGSLAVLRYLSAEVGNPSLRFLGGICMIILLFARFFFNSFKRRNL